MPTSGPRIDRSGVPEQHDGDKQQRQNRQSQEKVGQPHQRAVEPLEEAGQHAHASTEGQRKRHGGDAHRQGKPSAGQHAGEHVAAEVVRAQRMGERHALVLGPVVEVLRIDAVDHGAEQHRHRNQGEHRGAAQGPFVAPELPPDVPRQ